MLKEKPFSFPFEKTIRVITDTDCFCECDDQYAVAHFLMTPKFDMRCIIAEQFAKEGSEEKSYDEIVHITELMGLKGTVNILHGALAALPDEYTPIDSEGARFIIEEAMRDDPRPLYVCNQGAITNLASAYLLDPGIAEKITVIWIAGAPYPHGGSEFNLCNDINAAKVVFKSKLKLLQVPMNVYSTMRISFMELMTRVYPYGEIGKYLVENTMNTCKKLSETMEQYMDLLVEANKSEYRDTLPEFLRVMGRDEAAVCFNGEMWSLGDSSCIGLLHNLHLGKSHMAFAPYDIFMDGRYDLSKPGSREIRIYDDIDSKFILNDMCAKFKFYFSE